MMAVRERAPVAETPAPGPRRKLAILVNMVAPYRVAVYRRLAVHFELRLFSSGTERNRTTWGGEGEDQQLRVRRSRGITLGRRVRQGERVYDEKYLHLNPGYLADLARFRPDAVISIEMGPRTLAALAWGALYRRPVVIWWGGTRWTEREAGRGRRLLRAAIVRLARHWISYGQTSTDYLLSIGVPRDQILQIQNCVDEESFRRSARPALGLKPRPVLLYVGQLIQRKGVDQLLAAAARVQAEGLRFSLLLVGDGPEREALLARSRELGLENVAFHSAVPAATMPAIYRSADALVFPTNEDVWGLVVNEALWSGLPVLCSTRAGCAPEIVPPENHFDPENPDDFARALRRAALGQLAPADVSPLWKSAAVADAIADRVQAILETEARR